MLSAIRFWLSPQRRSFRRLARPALVEIDTRLARAGSPAAIRFISTLLEANAEFLAFALSTEGMLADLDPTIGGIRAALASGVIFSVSLFARDEMANDHSSLIVLLSAALGLDDHTVMLRRDQLRKAPKSEEWILYSWLRRDFGGAAPTYDTELERRFGYQYLSYIGQYRAMVQKAIAEQPSSATLI